MTASSIPYEPLIAFALVTEPTIMGTANHGTAKAAVTQVGFDAHANTAN